MLVSTFMIPATKVAICPDSDTISSALDALNERRVSCIVVLNELGQPIGLCTKTDFVQAYQNRISLDEEVGYIMSTNLNYVQDTETRDGAAAGLERLKTHHALVMDKDKKWVGLINSWDIAAECMEDGDAWPWIRSADGRFHSPMEAH